MLNNIEKTYTFLFYEDPWDADFMSSFTKKDLFAFILLCNSYKLTDPLHLGCAKVATMIKGKTPEEIKQICNM